MTIRSIGGLGAGPVEQLIAVERMPLEAAKARKGKVAELKNEYSALDKLLSDFSGATTSALAPGKFEKYTVDSSHPEILQGTIEGLAKPGTYEFEVRGLAQSDRHLDLGFPDSNESPVGFGYMGIETSDGKNHDIKISPNSTLADVATQINQQAKDVSARVVDTGHAGENHFKLLVSSKATGQDAKVVIDPDTTFLEFDNIKGAKDLDMLFEDVEVARAGNQINDLLEGVRLDAKRAEPGTRITLNVKEDIDATISGIKDFTEKYNKISELSQSQYSADPETGKLGKLASDGTLRNVMSRLQTAIASAGSTGSKFKSLTEIGITTDAKTGQLVVNEDKVKKALSSDYGEVNKLFTGTEGSQGLAARMSDAVRSLRDPASGVVSNRMKGLDRILKDQDRQVERQTQRFEEKKVQIEQKFARLNAQLAATGGQQNFLAARFGAASQPIAMPETQVGSGAEGAK